MDITSYFAQPDLAEQIIKKLSTYCELPSSGLIAGGSVANIIMADIHGGEQPVNDIDVFTWVFNDTFHTQKLKMPRRIIVPEVDIDQYGSVHYHNENGDGYAVTGSRRKGMLNTIKTVMTQDKGGEKNASTIIDGFDLNCCQAAIDLNTRKLVYSRDFEKFLATMQLRVTNPYTPFHTAIRLAKKAKELDCYCDYDGEMNYLSQVDLALYEKSIDRVPGYGMEGDIEVFKKYRYSRTFGKKYRRLFSAYEDIVGKYFTINEVDGEEGLFTLEPKVKVLDDAYEMCMTPGECSKVRDLVEGPKQAVVKKNRAVLATGNYMMLTNMLFRKGFAACDWHDKHLAKIRDFFSSNLFIYTRCFQAGYNLQEQYETVRFLERMANKHGHYVIGLVEQNWDPANVEGHDVLTEELVNSFIKANEAELTALLKEPACLDGFEKRAYVRELLTGADLMSIGILMHHCVGGYAYSVREGRSTIFQISKDGEESTLEIIKRTGDNEGYAVAQHHGKCNSMPSQGHLEIGKDLCTFMNKESSSSGWFYRWLQIAA